LVAESVTVRRIGVSLAVAAALLTSACAAGQQAATSNEKPTLDGANAAVADINLRGVLVEAPTGVDSTHYPVGSDAELKVVIVNNGRNTDHLVSVSSPAFGDWGAFATTAQAARVEAANAAQRAPKTTSAAPSPSATGTSASASGSASSTATSSTGASSASATPTPTRTRKPRALPQPLSSIAIDPGQRKGWGTPESKGTLLLLNATQVIYPGTTIQMTFTFANAGSVTFAVPIELSTAPNAETMPPVPSSSVPA
jgi:copper(I)-binding protein